MCPSRSGKRSIGIKEMLFLDGNEGCSLPPARSLSLACSLARSLSLFAPLPLNGDSCFNSRPGLVLQAVLLCRGGTAFGPPGSVFGVGRGQDVLFSLAGSKASTHRGEGRGSGTGGQGRSETERISGGSDKPTQAVLGMYRLLPLPQAGSTRPSKHPVSLTAAPCPRT